MSKILYSLPELKIESPEFGSISGLEEAKTLLEKHFEPFESEGWQVVIVDSRIEPLLRFACRLNQGKNILLCPPGFGKKDAIAVTLALQSHYLEDQSGFAAFMTSGSTGKPKVVVHSFLNLISAAEKITHRYPKLNGAKLHHLFPSHYMAGILNCLMVPWVAGGGVFLDEVFDFKSAYSIPKAIQGSSTHYAWLSPNMAQSMTEAWKNRKEVPEVWPMVLSATGPLFTTTRDEFESTFNSRIINTYGSTELLFISSEVQRDKEVSVGIFLPGVEGLIEQDLSPEGSLSIRSDSLATGVAKYNPSTGTYSHEYLAKEGFFETNDLVAMDAEGRIKLVGRVDDLVVLGGLNFNLLEIEEAALSYPGIVAACAFAPFGGSVSDLHLVVETSYENFNFSVEALMGHLKDKLGTSWPRRISRGLIVRTHNGKIDRRSTGSLFTNGAQL